MKKDFKLYNFILPPFILIGFSPWFLGISLVGNFLIDSAVLSIIMLVVFKKFDKTIYIKKIFWLWLLGFSADIIGLFYIFAVSLVGGNISYNNLPMIISGIIIAGGCIFLLDYFVFRKSDMTKKQAVLSALAFAVFTAPYTYMLRYFVFI